MYRKHDDDLTPEEQARVDEALKGTLVYQLGALREAFAGLLEAMLETCAWLGDVMEWAVGRIRGLRGKR